MAVEIKNGKIVGFLTLSDYAKKYHMHQETVRRHVYEKKLTALPIEIGKSRTAYFIREDEDEG